MDHQNTTQPPAISPQQQAPAQPLVQALTPQTDQDIGTPKAPHAYQDWASF